MFVLLRKFGVMLATAVTLAGASTPNVSAAPDQRSVDKCVDQWVEMRRREIGPDDPIGMDQLDEWEGWCKAGKTPSPKSKKVAGDISKASGCLEVSKILNVPYTGSNGLDPLLEANNQLRFVGGLLVQYENGAGIIQASDGSPSFAGFKVAKKTLWFEKDRLGIGRRVWLIGSYTRNTKFELVSGRIVQAPEFELKCIAPVSQAEIVDALMLGEEK